MRSTIQDRLSRFGPDGLNPTIGYGVDIGGGPTVMSTTDLDRPKVSTMAKRAGDDAADPAEVTGTRAEAVEARVRAFVETDHRRVVATVSLWSGSLDDATDAVTDALGRAWERLIRGASIDNLAAWVTHAAMNQIRSAHRRKKVAARKHHLVVVTEQVHDPNDRRDVHLDLRRALAELTRRQRDVLALYYGLDLPVSQIAETLRIAPGTVKATLYQARTRLATLLDDSAAPATVSDTTSQGNDD